MARVVLAELIGESKLVPALHCQQLVALQVDCALILGYFVADEQVQHFLELARLGADGGALLRRRGGRRGRRRGIELSVSKGELLLELEEVVSKVGDGPGCWPLLDAGFLHLIRRRSLFWAGLVSDSQRQRPTVLSRKGVAIEREIKLNGLTQTLSQEVLCDGALMFMRTAFHHSR